MRTVCLLASVASLPLAVLPARAQSPGGLAGLSVDRDASRNWQMAGMLSLGGIPNRTTVCATLSPAGNGQNDQPAIQRAVDACPAGQVLSLAAGNFTVSEGSFILLNKGITIRGAGAGKTILTRSDGARPNTYIPGNNVTPMILVAQQRWNNWAAGNTRLAADVAAHSYTLQVASPAGFAPGQIIMIDETSGAGWQPDPQGRGQIWAAPDFRVAWHKFNPPQPGDDFGANSYPYTSGTAGCWFADCDRPTNEMHRIKSISGNMLTLDSPITISYRVGHQAQVYYWNIPQMVWQAGVENMTIEHSDEANVHFDHTAYCWAKNVESREWLGIGITIAASFRTQLEGVYSHNADWPVPGGGGYAMSLDWWSSEALIENSISLTANKVMVARSAGTGSVIAYNYVDDGMISGQENWVEIGLNGSHMVGSHHILFEGNQTFNMDSDKTHGGSIYHTFFRNYSSGYRRPFTNTLHNVYVDDMNNRPGGNGPFRAAAAMAYSYWMSFVGNVLGTQGHTNGWSYNSPGGGPGIFMLGWDDQSPYRQDQKVLSTAYRNGNFDYLTNSVHWASSFTARTLPDSLYLPGKPAFFGGSAWPWVNPAGSPQLGTLPAKARFDAGAPVPQN